MEHTPSAEGVKAGGKPLGQLRDFPLQFSHRSADVGSMGATVASKPIRPLRVLPLRALSDERLAELAAAGHADAFGALYERYREALARYCRSIVRDLDDAGDALQNTMVAVLRAIQVCPPNGPVRPWLYRIAHNESVSIIRRRHPHEELSVETPDRADVELARLARDRLDSLLIDLRSLPERQRGAIVMRELGGLDYEEIGTALRMSAVSARKAVFEARHALHDLDDARETDCMDIRRRISNGDGRVLRARGVRGHLRGCASCSAFERGLHARRGTFALIPALPALSAGALLATLLPGAGAGAGGASTSGITLGGSAAAAGSALGGGSLAAVKGIALGGVIAMAGAGVLVGSGIGSHVTRPHRVAGVVAHPHRMPRAVAATATVAHVSKPARALVRAPDAPGSSHRVAAVVTSQTTPGSAPPAVSTRNAQGPRVNVPVAASTTPTVGTSRPTAPPATPPSSTPTTPTSAGTPPGSSTPAAVSPSAPADPATIINTIIQSALQSATASVAAAQAQAAQALATAGQAATATVQGILSALFHGQG